MVDTTDYCDPQDDCFKPPAIPTQVYCLHCGQEYESYLIHWVEYEEKGKKMGFWCCPTADCGGKGFGFDIFPTDPEYRDENGELMWVDDDEGEEGLDDDDDLDDADLDLDIISEFPKDDKPRPSSNNENVDDEEDIPW